MGVQKNKTRKHKRQMRRQNGGFLFGLFGTKVSPEDGENPAEITKQQSTIDSWRQYFGLSGNYTSVYDANDPNVQPAERAIQDLDESNKWEGSTNSDESPSTNSDDTSSTSSTSSGEKESKGGGKRRRKSKRKHHKSKRKHRKSKHKNT